MQTDSPDPLALYSWRKAPFATGLIPPSTIVSMPGSFEAKVSFRLVASPASSLTRSCAPPIGVAQVAVSTQFAAQHDEAVPVAAPSSHCSPGSTTPSPQKSHVPSSSGAAPWLTVQSGD